MNVDLKWIPEMYARRGLPLKCFLFIKCCAWQNKRESKPIFGFVSGSGGKGGKTP